VGCDGRPLLLPDVRAGAPGHVEHLERSRAIYQKVIFYAQALGLDMIEGDYEDPGQLELNWTFDHANLTADQLITYRQVCRQVGRELGVTPSFMLKSATGMMGTAATTTCRCGPPARIR
jgi:glutamine synthetase